MVEQPTTHSVPSSSGHSGSTLSGTFSNDLRPPNPLLLCTPMPWWHNDITDQIKRCDYLRATMIQASEIKLISESKNWIWIPCIMVLETVGLSGQTSSYNWWNLCVDTVGRCGDRNSRWLIRPHTSFSSLHAPIGHLPTSRSLWTAPATSTPNLKMLWSSIHGVHWL